MKGEEELESRDHQVQHLLPNPSKSSMTLTFPAITSVHLSHNLLPQYEVLKDKSRMFPDAQEKIMLKQKSEQTERMMKNEDNTAQMRQGVPLDVQAKIKKNCRSRCLNDWRIR